MRRLLAPLGTCLLVWAAGFIGSPLARGAEPTDAVPDSASIVVRWKSPQASLGQLADFVDAVQPGLGGVVRSSLPGIGQVIGNPGLKGVDSEQDLWAIIFFEPQVPPTTVFVITAKDVDDVKDALPVNFEIHTSGKLVAYSEDADALQTVSQRMDGEGNSFWSKIDAASKTVFNGADLSVAINVKQLTQDFADELGEAEPRLEALIEQITNALPETQKPQLEAAMGMYLTIGKALLHGVRDTNSMVLGFKFTKDAIRYDDRVQVADGSNTAKYLASQEPGTLSLVNKLPADKAFYVGVKADLSNFIQWSMNFAKTVLADASDEQKAQFDSSAKEMAKLKFEEMAMYFDLVADSPAFRAGSVLMVTPTKNLKDISRKMAKTAAEIKTAGFTQTTTLEPDAEKFGASTADRITITQEFDDAADPTGMQKKMMTMLFGNAGMQQLTMYQDKRVLQTMGGGGKAEMQNLVTALDSTKPNDATVAAVRSQFVEKANLLVLADAARLTRNGLTFAAENQTIPADAESLKGLELKPSYVGYALACEANGVRSQLVIPVVQVQNFAKIAPLIGPRR